MLSRSICSLLFLCRTHHTIWRVVIHIHVFYVVWFLWRDLPFRLIHACRHSYLQFHFFLLNPNTWCNFLACRYSSSTVLPVSWVARVDYFGITSLIAFICKRFLPVVVIVRNQISLNSFCRVKSASSAKKEVIWRKTALTSTQRILSSAPHCVWDAEKQAMICLDVPMIIHRMMSRWVLFCRNCLLKFSTCCLRWVFICTCHFIQETKCCFVFFEYAYESLKDALSPKLWSKEKGI